MKEDKQSLTSFAGSYHEPVMVREVLEYLHINKARKNNWYIDATVGTGGHAVAIVKEGGCVLGIDQDKEMLAVARRRLETCPTPFRAERCYSLVQGNFRNIETIAKGNKIDKVSGILFDLGVSNIHLKDVKRGFSFENPDAELDMRLDPDSQNVTAADLLNTLREDQLKKLFRDVTDNSSSRWLTKRVVERRMVRPFRLVGDFLEMLKGFRGKARINPATLPFLALRIAVNTELENLKEALPSAFNLLGVGGRLVVISFHSLEDEIVKDFFSEKEKEGKGKILTEKPVIPSLDEVERNPKSRSAKLRAIEKI